MFFAMFNAAISDEDDDIGIMAQSQNRESRSHYTQYARQQVRMTAKLPTSSHGLVKVLWGSAHPWWLLMDADERASIVSSCEPTDEPPRLQWTAPNPRLPTQSWLNSVGKNKML